MLKAIVKDLNGRFADVKDLMAHGMAYTCSKEEAQEWKAEIEERFPGYEIMEGPLSLSVACHFGPGALAITCMNRLLTGNCDEIRSILEVGSEQIRKIKGRNYLQTHTIL